jgi:hypothetical protein
MLLWVDTKMEEALRYPQVEAMLKLLRDYKFRLQKPEDWQAFRIVGGYMIQANSEGVPHLVDCAELYIVLSHMLQIKETPEMLQLFEHLDSKIS